MAPTGGTGSRHVAEVTGHIPRLYAYPYGEYTAALAEVVQAQDLIGFGQHSGAIGPKSDFGALPRFPIGGNYADLQRLATSLKTRPLYVQASPPGPLILSAGTNPDTARPELRIGVRPGPYRLSQLACYATSQGNMTINAGGANGTYRIRPSSPLGVGRSKFNCTVPHATEAGVYYWWSYLLMRPNADGSWYRG